ncbi:hypothetical protein H4R18_005035 [Coemansia javaensis]|uniref:histidine--tRNA ligase n=1 Tax=Coemansia javaensis TaxID=2761396 RepID=A0A9W8H7P4_9FUNG|nr:hypothetical protein H4R18_005035 [Coemansia javaensis]
MPGLRVAKGGRRWYSARRCYSVPRAVRGMADRFGAAERRHQHIVRTAQATAESFGFAPVHTPVLEYSSVFERTLGAGSDVVNKELYRFLDSSQQWMTMRPEGTAGVARALATSGLDRAPPQKLYYSGPMFRHERPQRGRLRQFEQFGVEAVGMPHPAADVECIQAGWAFLAALGIAGRSLQLNTLGDAPSRQAYRAALQAYFADRRAGLSEESRRRLDTNPLRILDSKDPADAELAAAAPDYADYLTPDSHRHFDFVRHGLDALRIPFAVNTRLVRGLDYYRHTVWEVVCADDRLGRSQATVLAGGRYDGLAASMGGAAALPGVGWAAGVERLALLLDDAHMPPAPAPVPVLAIPERAAAGPSGSRSREVSSDVYLYALQVASRVRERCAAYVVHATGPDAAVHQSLGKQLAAVLSRDPAPARVVIVGSAEMAARQAIVRDTATHAQQVVDIDSIGAVLAQ